MPASTLRHVSRDPQVHAVAPHKRLDVEQRLGTGDKDAKPNLLSEVLCLSRRPDLSEEDRSLIQDVMVTIRSYLCVT
jgi:hypothetical protein